MYTGDTSSSIIQGNTKSSIQALLKNKEYSLAGKQFSADLRKEKNRLYNYCASPDLADFGAISTNLECDTNNQALLDHVSNNINSQENLEYQKDFNYSQKLFHIADGNLYSIFSPIQGRSYGMKPSFLRKQKYTVQECHNRGRKSLRKGLKFHNFLPSESVTSEKDNGYLDAKWKVHSECRLREEHGTKQITISNWSQSIKNPNETNSRAKTPVQTPPLESNCTEQLSILKCENPSLDEKNKTDINDPYDFNLQSSSSENINLLAKINIDSVQNSSTSTKKDALNFLLNSLIEKPLKFDNKNSFDDSDIQNNKTSHQKHRRKPIQTRRVVPYVKYLSIMEENESLPLDLSSKCLIENSSSHSTTSSSDDSQNISGKNDLDFTKTSFVINDKTTKSANLNYAVSSSSNMYMPNLSSDKLSNSLSGIMPTQVTAPVAVLYPLPFSKSTNIGQNGFPPIYQTPKNSKIDINANLNTAFTTIDKPYSVINQPHSSSSAFSVQKSFVKEVPSKPRRRNQRSAIKQRLEDTFRQNGFLVKTKQVSDGEATFCKFRQLRKYTRYYLKSLEQHLPDEFHKMWKGFLPPKTVLPPPVSGTQELSNENTS